MSVETLIIGLSLSLLAILALTVIWIGISDMREGRKERS